jgi:hypothetical protein
MDFQQAENRFKRLKAQFEAGTLSETEFRVQLEGLMIRDEQGSWWMIGYETGLWYRHDGTNWVRTDLSSVPTQKSVLIPLWVIMFWIILGWASGPAIGIAMGLIVAKNTSWIIGMAIGGAISGAIGGFSLVTALRAENILYSRRSMLWITLAWAIGTLINWPYSVSFSWTIGGLCTAIFLRAQNTLSDWRSILWVTLGWTVASAIGWAICAAINRAIVGDMSWVIGWTIGGAVGGIIGGSIMIWQLGNGKR